MLLPFISLKVNVTYQNRCHFSVLLFPLLKQLEKAVSVYMCVCVHDRVQSRLGLVADGIKGTYNCSVFHQGIWRVRTIAVPLEDRRGFYKLTAFRTSSFKHYSQGWISFSFTDLRIFKWFRQSAAFFFWILPYEGFLALLAMIVLNILLLLSFSFKTGISTVKHFNLLTICYLLSILSCLSVVPYTAMKYLLHLLMLLVFIKTAEYLSRAHCQIQQTTTSGPWSCGLCL